MKLTALALAASLTAALSAAPLPQPNTVPGEATPQAWFTGQPKPTFDQLQAMPKDTLPVYGLYTWGDEYLKFRKELNECGFKSYRLGGPLNDTVMTALCEDGAFVMKTLGKGKYDTYNGNIDSFVIDELAFYRKFLERYGPDGAFFKENPKVPYKPVTCVEIRNEPNFHYMYQGTGQNSKDYPVRAQVYARLLVSAYRMVKEHWPAVSVVAFNCGGGGATGADAGFINMVLDESPDVAHSFDIASTHPYVNPSPPEAWTVKSWGSASTAGQLAKIRHRFGEVKRKNAPIWYAEGGWVLHPDDGGIFTKNKGEGLPALLHAAYYVRYYAWSLRLGVNRVMPMFIVDSDSYNGGIFQRTEEWEKAEDPWRPASRAIQTMIKVMPFPELTGIIADETDGYFAYVFKADRKDKDSKNVIMLWDTDGGSTERMIPVAGKKAVLIDMLGNEMKLKVTDGTVTVPVGAYPVYVLPQ